MTNLTPADVAVLEFSEKRKGYDPDEVQLFMDDVRETLAAGAERVSTLERELASATSRAEALSAQAGQVTEADTALHAEVDALRGELAREKAASKQALDEAAAALASAKEQLSQMEGATQAAEAVELLEAARLTAQETISRAREHSERVRLEGDIYAANTREAADTYSIAIREAAERDLAGIRTEAAALRESEAAYRSRAAGILRSALEFIEVHVEYAGDNAALEEVTFEEVEAEAVEVEIEEAFEEAAAEAAFEEEISAAEVAEAVFENEEMPPPVAEENANYGHWQ